MNSQGAQKILSVVLSFILLTTSPQLLYGYQASASAPANDAGNPTDTVPLSASQLEALVAPIALYPDSLVAQILGAATFPDQVAAADSWLQENSYLTGTTLMQTVNTQPWDPSVKALTQFPSVLGNLAKNLSWASSLGEAYHNQAADVMSAIQVLRAKALAAGNLKSGSQIVVTQESPQVIVIQPTNPQVVYVPTFNPAIVYGYPYVTPGYSTAAIAATAVVAFGVGIAVGAMMSGGCCGWGYGSWNCGWYGTNAVVYHGGAYYGNSAWHGGYYGSSGSVYGPYGSAHYSSGYNPSTGTYARGGTVSNGYGSQSVGQAYNPRTGAYGQTEQGSNANGSWGSSTVSKNGNTAYTQHQTTSQGTTGQMHTSNGASAYGASGRYNSAAVGQAANGNKYATANGNAYKNTGSGWEKNNNGSWNNSWAQHDTAGRSNAFSGMSGHSGGFGGSSGWSSRADSGRGWGSMASSGFSGGRFGGGGGDRGGFGGGGFRR
jgi:Protein of unknown function (DUF3300)